MHELWEFFFLYKINAFGDGFHLILFFYQWKVNSNFIYKKNKKWRLQLPSNKTMHTEKLFIVKSSIIIRGVSKSIRPAFIFSRLSDQLASAVYERNQQSLTKFLNAVVTGRTPWVARSVCLCPTGFFRSSYLFTVENDRKNKSTNLHQVLLQSQQELYGDD